LVKGNLVRGLPTKVFENDNTWVACKKASNTEPPVSFVDQPLFRLHMDLFGPTFVKSLNKKSYCLVITDDYHRFTWVFFLATKDETSPILKTLIPGLENQLSLKVKVIRSDNGTEFKNYDLNQLYSLLPIPFWAEVVNTACYVQNRVLVTKPHNKTPYELLHGRPPIIGFMRSFGCHVTILNTLDPLGKFQGKINEGFLVGYSNKPNVTGTDPTWLFDIDSLTRTMNYQPVTAGNQTNPDAEDAAFDGKEYDFDVKKLESEVILSPSSSAQSKEQDDKTKKEAKGKIPTIGQNSLNNTNTFSAAGPSNDADITYSDDEDVVGAEADSNNLESYIPISPIPTIRIHKDHPVSQIIGDLSSTTQIRSMTSAVKDQGFEDPDHPDKVYKIVKALYGLHQAPRAWYETLATYLLENGFQRSIIDQTLFIKKQKGDILLVKQTKDGIFISQDKYIAEILRKFGLIEGKSASTPIDIEKPLLKDPDVCACAHFQVTPKALHLHAVKRNFRYLKGKLHLGLWYLMDSPFDLVAYLDSDYSWLVQKQTALGKDKSNPLMADNLPKIVWYSTHHITLMKSWLVQKQTALGKDKSNPLMVDNFPKVTNDITRLQALVDRKKVVITEAAIRDVLRLDDTERVDCLPNEEIFAKLARMGYERPSIKLIFYKAFFSSQVGKGFSGVETPLFKGMLVARVIEEEGDAEEQEILDACATLTRRVEHLKYDKVAQALEIIKLKRRVKKLEKGNRVKGRMIDNLDKDDAVDLMDDKGEEKKEEEVKDDQEDDPAEVQKVVDVVTTAKLITEVVTAYSETVTADSTTISAAEPQVPAAAITTVAPVRVAAASTRRIKRVVIRDPEEESTTIIAVDTKSKDKCKGIMDVAIEHVKQKAKEDPFGQRYLVIKKMPQTEAQARKNMIMYLKNVVSFRLDYFKGMSYDDICLIFEAKFNSNIAFLLKTKEQLEEEENRAIQSINETPATKAAKRRKLKEEVEDLKKHLEIMPDKDDDVYTEATPLARKLYVSFLTLLKNFDREDLESLLSLVKERFSTFKPNNFSDDFLLTTLRAMFERPNEQAQVWKNQRTVHGQAKVKSWKLLESYGVHIITFTTTQLILLVERRYPLSRFTLDQMLNAVRLRVEEQSEMSLELLRFTRQQHQEGQLE
nr:hypothetical protein [Tanacetum cinerariifolium]